MRRAETLALEIRSVRRARRVTEMFQPPIEQQAQPRPIIRRRNSIANEAVNVAVPVDPNFIALIQELVIRDGQCLNAYFFILYFNR